MSDVAPPRVSVVIPCYNAAPFVAETLESVLAQSHPATEAIVVDDGSTDGSWGEIGRFGDRVGAVRKENGGVAAARNLGALHATGEYLLFLDADDLLSRDAVAELVAAHDGSDAVIAACPWRRLVEHRPGQWITEPAEQPFPLTYADALEAWLRGEWIAGCSLLWPRVLFQRLGGYDESLSADEDGDIVYRALLQGSRLVYTSRGESLYRSHGTSRLSASVDVYAEHRFRSRMRVFEKVEEALRSQGRFERYRDAVGVAYLGLAQRTFAANPGLAREALERGEAYAGRVAIAPTAAGRLLVRLLGMDGKERMARALARFGVMTPGRRRLMQRGKLQDGAAKGAGEVR